MVYSILKTRLWFILTLAFVQIALGFFLPVYSFAHFFIGVFVVTHAVGCLIEIRDHEPK